MKHLPILFALLLVCCSFNLSAKSGKSIFDYWSTTENVSLELHVNFAEIEANRTTLQEIPATVKDENQEFPLEVSVRGKYRRRTCAMPPLKLQFGKDALRAAGLNTHNDYKLVTHCTNGEEGQDALMREQLAYQLYSTINPSASFRTQLITITYVNTEDGSTITSYAILIEDTDELKDRLAAANCKDCYNAPLQQFTNVEIVTLFQYMIGNADYSTRMGRNLKLMRNDSGQLTAVPYDFDYSGLVDPVYATGLTHLGQHTVKDRVLRWEFENNPELQRAGESLLALQDELLEEIENFSGLQTKSKKEITKYVKGFFRELKSGSIGS